jgi:hypothetical protein
MGQPRKLSTSSLFRPPPPSGSGAAPAPARSITPVSVRRPEDARIDKLAREFLEAEALASLPPPLAPALEPDAPDADEDPHVRETAPPPPGYDELPRESGIRSKGSKSLLPAAAVDAVVANVRRDSRYEEDD